MNYFLASLGFLVWSWSLSSVLAASVADSASLHFDSSVANTLEVEDGKVVRWNDLQGRGKFQSLSQAQAPTLGIKALAGKDVVQFHGKDSMKLATDKTVRLGAISLYLVGRADSTAPGQYFISSADTAKFNLATGERQFECELGTLSHARKRGAPVDSLTHVFALSHVLSTSPNDTLKPGRFDIDGVLNGHPFCRDSTEITDTLQIGSRADGGYLKGSVAEILIFDRKLSNAEKQALVSELAAKWGVKLKETEGTAMSISRLKPVSVIPEGQYGSFGIYNQTPESPDGKRIAYILFKGVPSPQTPYLPFSIWTRDRDLKEPPKFVQEPDILVNNHNGAVLQWVNDRLLTYCGFTYDQGSKKRKRVLFVIDATSGKVVHGPYTGAFLGEGSTNGKILISVDDPASNVGPQGLYVLDTHDGKITCVVKMEDLKPYVKGGWAEYLPNSRRWKMPHPQFSPKGTRLMFELDPGGKILTFTCRSDGSELKYWGDDKPLHELFFDEDSICGADEMTDDGHPDDLAFRRWDLDRNVLETLGGLVCHTAVSDDRQWGAGESFYGSEKVTLRLYRRGETRATAEIPAGLPSLIWKDSGHVNPSFSRDGKRLYFHYAADDGTKQPSYVDISELIRDPAPTTN